MKSTTLKEIANILGTATTSHAVPKGVAVDSRLLEAGDLFFALPGAKTDGHAHLENVAARGAVGAIVKSDYKGPDHGLPLIRVENTLNALQLLSKTFLKASKVRVVAVTGSLGKTTTKDFIATILKHKFNVTVSPGNNNSQIGLPLTILNHATLDEDVIVLEMGMTHTGQIAKLIEIAAPEVAVVTMVALVHACNFDSLEGIGHSKAEIFCHQSTKLGIYHLESNINGALSQRGVCPKLTFSTTSANADFFLQADTSGMRVSDSKKTHAHLPLLPVPGDHNRHNFLAAVAVARYFGMSWDEIKMAQDDLELPEKRLQPVEKFGALFINDAYNASEVSMKAALRSLPAPKSGGKKIAVLGEIVELGKFSEGCHRAVGKYALEHVDCMLCYGDGCLPILEEWESAGRLVVWAKERSEIVAALRERLIPGDVVLLKGSRAKAVCKVLDEL